MAKFQPGKSGNPSGRPAKSRSLTTLLEKTLSQTVDRDGEKLAAKRLLADLVMEAVTTGRVKFPGEDKLSVLDVKEWIDFVKWVYQYLEPPITRQEVTGKDGAAIEVIHVKPKADDD